MGKCTLNELTYLQFFPVLHAGETNSSPAPGLKHPWCHYVNLQYSNAVGLLKFVLFTGEKQVCSGWFPALIHTSIFRSIALLITPKGAMSFSMSGNTGDFEDLRFTYLLCKHHGWLEHPSLCCTLGEEQVSILHTWREAVLEHPAQLLTVESETQ